MLKSREKTFQLSLTLKARILSRFRSVGQIFCLGLGLYRLTSPATDILQRVLNAAARVITDTRKFDRGLRQILHDQLHWLDVPDRVLVKLAVTVHQCLNGRAQPYAVSVGALHPGLQCWHAPASAFRQLLPVPRFRPTLTAISCWPDGLDFICGIQRAAQTVLGVYLKRTCSRVTSASSALGVRNDYALYKSTHWFTPR